MKWDEGVCHGWCDISRSKNWATYYFIREKGRIITNLALEKRARSEWFVLNGSFSFGNYSWSTTSVYRHVLAGSCRYSTYINVSYAQRWNLSPILFPSFLLPFLCLGFFFRFCHSPHYELSCLHTSRRMLYDIMLTEIHVKLDQMGESSFFLPQIQ